MASALSSSSCDLACTTRCSGRSSVDVSPGGLYRPRISMTTLQALQISSCVALRVSEPFLGQSLMSISIENSEEAADAAAGVAPETPEPPLLPDSI